MTIDVYVHTISLKFEQANIIGNVIVCKLQIYDRGEQTIFAFLSTMSKNESIRYLKNWEHLS
jgi:hypothetical protein